MIVLDSTLKSLELVLSGAVSTTALDWVASYVDITTPTTTPTAFISGESDGTSNNTTNVTVVSAPASTHQRQVKFLSVENLDTAAATIKINYNNNGTRRRIYTATLAVGYTLTYTDGDGWRVWTTTGALLTSVGDATIQVAQIVITNAQIKTLPSTPVTLVAAPGANSRVRVLGVSTALDVTTTTYTGLDTSYANCVVCNGTAASGLPLAQGPVNDDTLTAPVSDLTKWLAGATHESVIDFITPPSVPISAASSGALEWNLTWPPPSVGFSIVKNAAAVLSIDNNGSATDLGGGNVANSLRVTIYYAIEFVS